MKPTTPTPIRGLHHLTLPVSDLERARAFYVDLLGLPLDRVFDRDTFLRFRPDRAADADADHGPLHVSLHCGTVLLELFLVRSHRVRPPAPHPHVAFAVAPDELDLRIRYLTDAGIPWSGPHNQGPPSQASVYFTDPFGNLLEFTTMGYAGAVVPGQPRLEGLLHSAPVP